MLSPPANGDPAWAGNDCHDCFVLHALLKTIFAARLLLEIFCTPHISKVAKVLAEISKVNRRSVHLSRVTATLRHGMHSNHMIMDRAVQHSAGCTVLPKGNYQHKAGTEPRGFTDTNNSSLSQPIPAHHQPRTPNA